jgi:hypothetical protein
MVTQAMNPLCIFLLFSQISQVSIYAATLAISVALLTGQTLKVPEQQHRF